MFLTLFFRQLFSNGGEINKRCSWSKVILNIQHVGSDLQQAHSIWMLALKLIYLNYKKCPHLQKNKKVNVNVNFLVTNKCGSKVYTFY